MSEDEEEPYRKTFLHHFRIAFYQINRFLKIQAGDLTNSLDNFNLVLAKVSQYDCAFGLLLAFLQEYAQHLLSPN